jgi:hypothetical protein
MQKNLCTNQSGLFIRYLDIYGNAKWLYVFDGKAWISLYLKAAVDLGSLS